MYLDGEWLGFALVVVVFGGGYVLHRWRWRRAREELRRRTGRPWR